MALTPRARAWRDRGGEQEVRGRRIHVFEREGRGPRLLLLHGFPSSSFDWRLLLEQEPGHAVLAFDCLGFGLSEKPARHDYTLAEQADIAEDLLERNAPGETVFLVGHDIGTSVATELMARDLDGSSRIDIAGALLLNGSMVQGAASPTLGQRLLRGPLGPLFSRLSSERFFRAQFGSIFSEAHPLDAEEAADQWSLVVEGGGRTLGHRLIAYMDERRRLAERWHGALRDWGRPIHLAWGLKDPVATPRVLDAVRTLRPAAPVIPLGDLGHYPQIEDPASVADALRAALRA